MSSIDNSTNSNRQSQNGQQNPEIQPNSTSAMQAEDMDGQWFEEAGPDGDGEDCTDSSSSKIKPDYFDRRISTQRVYGDHTIGREFPSETSKVVDQTVKSLTASSTLERERLHTDGGSTSKPVIAENVDDVIAILNKSEFLSELKSIPSPGSKESQNYGFRHPLETEESPEKCFGQSSGRDNGYSNGRPATLPEKLAELVLAMQMNVGEIAKNAADEWDNDDDNGYIIIPLSEEEYDELEVEATRRMVQMKSVSQEEIDQELEQDGNSFAVDELTNAKSIDSMVMDPDNVENILEYQFSVSKSQSHSDISNEISLPSKAAERLDRVKEVLSGEDDEDNLSDSSSGPLPEKKLFRPATTADLYEAVVLERSMSEDLTQKLRASRDIQPDAGSADCSVLGGDMSIEAIASASFDELALSQMNKDQPAKQEGGQAEPSFLSPGSTASSAHVASNHKPSWTVTEESIFSPASTMSSEDLAKVLADGGFASPIQSQSNIIPMPPVPPPIGFGMMPAVAAENKRQSIGDKRRLEIIGQERFLGVDGLHCSFNLKVIFEPNKTGFEETKDLQHPRGAIIAGRYEVSEILGQAAFSTALQCIDLVAEEHEPEWVCLKVIKNNKDFFDQSLDEIKLLQYINSHGDPDKHHVLRLIDFFYYKEHLIIVSELLKENLYEFSRFVKESGNEPYYTFPRLKRIMKQVLTALEFTHSLNLIHCDIKPENIVIKSFSRCEVKLIDFGSSCFTTDHLTTYIQSRSYRAPEVIIGHKYDSRIDIWSLGAVLAELHTGYVLFQNDSVSTMLSRITGILGNFPLHVLGAGRETHKYFTPNNIVYDRDEDENYLLIFPKKTNLRDRVHLPSKLSMDEELFLDFLYQMLDLDPEQRLTASEALQHPWLADADSVYVSEYIIQPPKVAAGAFSNRDDNDDFEDVYNGEEDEDDEDDDDNYEDYDDDVNDQRFQSNYETDIDNPATYLDDEDDDGVGLHDVGSVDADDSPEKNASKM